MLKRKYNIRLAEDRDLPFLPKLEKRVAGIEPDNLLPRWMRGRTTLDMSDFLLARRNNTLWVAEHWDDLAGFALAMPLNGVPLLYEVSVLPEETRRGLDGALVDAVLRRAAEKGYQRLWTTTFGSLAGNNALYRQRGFMPVGEEGGTPKPVDLLLKKQHSRGLKDRVAMYKDLDIKGHA